MVVISKIKEMSYLMISLFDDLEGRLWYLDLGP